MKTINATPAADYPEQVVVAQDATFAARNPNAAYWLRVKVPDNGVGVHQLPGDTGPTHARQMASGLGFARPIEPTRRQPAASVLIEGHMDYTAFYDQADTPIAWIGDNPDYVYNFLFSGRPVA